MNELPHGWYETPLETVVDILDSRRIPLNSDEREQRTYGKADHLLFPYYGATGQVGVIDDYLFDGDYILLGEDGVPFFDPLRHKAYRAHGKFWVNNHAHVLQAINGLSDYRFIEKYLNVFDYKGYVSGSTRLKLTQAAMRSMPVRLAPLNEQKRIADKLDAVLARVDACRYRLDRVPAILKRFRQSVLAAATSGKLTEEWRDNSGLLSTNVSKQLSEIADVIDPHPSHRTPPVVAGGVPYIGIGEVDKKGCINLANAKTVSWAVYEEHKKRYQARKGDFIFGKIGTLGRPTCLPVGEKYVISANVILIQPNPEKVDPRYLLLQFSSPKVLSDIAGQANSTSQSAFGIKKMRAFSLILPSKQEQCEIVRRVESLFAYADRLEARYTNARARTERLTPSLLAKAFRGELVPQDPNDESASKLLEHIRSISTPESSKPRSRKLKVKESVS